MGQVYLNGPRSLSGPKSKLGLPSVTMELDKSFNQSPQGGLEKISYMSSNGPPKNCCKGLNKYLIGHVLGGQNGGSKQYKKEIQVLRQFTSLGFIDLHD